MLTRQLMRGFTLIELVITLVLLTILLAFGMSSFSGWMNNSKARSVAESVQNGVRAAQTEAVRRSRQTAFVLTNATPGVNAAAAANGTNWYIQALPIVSTEVVNTPFVQGGSFGNLASGVTITGPAVICFNSMGRMVTNALATTTAAFGASCTAVATNYDVTRAGANRTLEIQVAIGGQVRICDKSKVLSTTNPDGC